MIGWLVLSFVLNKTTGSVIQSLCYFSFSHRLWTTDLGIHWAHGEILFDLQCFVYFCFSFFQIALLVNILHTGFFRLIFSFWRLHLEGSDCLLLLKMGRFGSVGLDSPQTSSPEPRSSCPEDVSSPPLHGSHLVSLTSVLCSGTPLGIWMSIPALPFSPFPDK